MLSNLKHIKSASFNITEQIYLKPKKNKKKTSGIVIHWTVAPGINNVVSLGWGSVLYAMSYNMNVAVQYETLNTIV